MENVDISEFYRHVELKIVAIPRQPQANNVHKFLNRHSEALGRGTYIYTYIATDKLYALYYR